MNGQSFFVTTMPSSRPADYYLGYMDGCVFLDFNDHGHNKVRLIRISFDGYGCCELGEHSIPLDEGDSKSFKDSLQAVTKEQNTLSRIIRRAIELNKKIIWPDALQEYCLAEY